MMPTITGPTGTQSWQRYSKTQRLARWIGWIIGLGLFALSMVAISRRTEWAFVADAGSAALDILSRMVPPDAAYTGTLLQPLWDTLNIATLGTLLAILLAAPVAICAAHNTTPSRTLVRPVALFIIVTSRSVNSLIWALLLVAILGPGVLAGIIAIALRSIGFIAKLLYEAIEEVSQREVEAIKSTGAPGPLVFGYAILPQIMPAFTGISVFRWDINIRESTVLGFVGAGGIGLQLNAAMQSLAWSQVSTILLCILGTVLISEWVSARLRSLVT